MQINALQIKVGNVLDIDGELYRVTYTQHVTPGKGVACMQTKMKNIVNGKNLEKRFRSAEMAEKVSLTESKMQYLFEGQDAYTFMDNETFDQIELSADLVGDDHYFLVEGETYSVQFHEENPIGLELPNSVELKVTYAPKEVRKATASASLRPVELENGMTINAPVFIKEGDVLRVNTSTKEYMERA